MPIPSRPLGLVCEIMSEEDMGGGMGDDIDRVLLNMNP